MRFERNINVKEALSLGVRGIIKKAFDIKNTKFQPHVYDAMQMSSNWDYEKRSWKKITYYIVEVRDVEAQIDKLKDPAWSYYVPASEKKTSLFYVEKWAVVKMARAHINRIEIK